MEPRPVQHESGVFIKFLWVGIFEDRDCNDKTFVNLILVYLICAVLLFSALNVGVRS